MMQYTCDSGSDVSSNRISLSKIFEEEARSQDDIAPDVIKNRIFTGLSAIPCARSSRVLISPLTLVVLAACGGGGGATIGDRETGPAENDLVSGRVVKGPLANAFVFADIIANGIFDLNEPSTITDSSGRFTLNGVGSANIIATTTASTIDLSSDVVIDGLTLSAPASARVITPFTTVISQADGTLTATQVSSILGLPNGVDLLSFDPFSEGVNTADAARIEVVAQQMIATMRGLAAVAQGAGVSEQEAMATAFGAIVALIEKKNLDGVGAIDFASAEDLNAISGFLKSTLLSFEAQSDRDLNFDILDALSVAVLTAVRNVNDEIDKEINQIIDNGGALVSDTAKAVFSIIGSLQSQVVAAVESEGLIENSGSALIDFVDVEKVSNAILRATPSVLGLTKNVVFENDADLRVGTFYAMDDAELPVNALSIVQSGDYWQYFEIENSNELRLKASADFEDIAEFNILIDVSDVGGKALQQAFTISVLDVNEQPTITSSAPLNITKGNTYTYNLSVSDPDAGDALTITATTLPDWLSFNPETLVLTGTPTGDDLGKSEVFIEVSDGALSTSQSFSIDVNNTIGSVIVIVDQFSDRIFQLGLQNLTLFDYGTLRTERWYDFEENGYTGYESSVTIAEDTSPDFFQLSYDKVQSVYPEILNAQTTNLFDYDYLTSGFVEGVGLDRDVFDDYSVLERLDQTSDSEVNRGDWALEALLRQLESPEKTAIIAIDLDTLDGADSHYQKLFDAASFSFPESGLVEGTVLEQIIFDWLSANDYRISGDSSHNDYLLSAVTISIPGAPENVELTTLDYLASLQAPIVQAVPTSTQGVHDWGNNYTDVIHVGAWNVDDKENLLISSQASLEVVDILADGIVSKEGWGTNFDPSFAAPRVTAEITNVINNMIQYLESQGTSLDVAQQDSVEFEIYYANLINSILETIGTSVSFDIDDGFTTEEFVQVVLSSDLDLINGPNIVTSPNTEDFAWGAIGNIEVLTSDSLIA